ncbi:cytochrome C oxidase subunit IV family protein [Candidatus Protofrankia californiensis]|uniref:cytochrome C oxidase subunit IV family protein n=1 Tax=Candidatus Protofrankia californiensis TaxID=1839754 RepID=UPI0010410916|nr:cytochrome C oxidase subunit IV family protein [Candidatus Protofrankia californiensis]
MSSVVRTRATGVWLILVLATSLSWVLGTDHGLSNDGHRMASVAIMVVALFKVRLVGLYFMDLRNAPAVLRALLEGYCVAVCAVMISLFLLA